MPPTGQGDGRLREGTVRPAEGRGRRRRAGPGQASHQIGRVALNSKLADWIRRAAGQRLSARASGMFSSIDNLRNVLRNTELVPFASPEWAYPTGPNLLSHGESADAPVCAGMVATKGGN